ncbi:MAG: methyltransferase domain-containing protein [Burkholderiales bacterium]
MPLPRPTTESDAEHLDADGSAAPADAGSASIDMPNDPSQDDGPRPQALAASVAFPLAAELPAPAVDFGHTRPFEPDNEEPVPPATDALHVYAREINEGERTSLSVLAGRIHGGATVLDLGCGSGAIGKFLKERKGCTVDGVTYNAAEARIAAPHYRSVVVADLSKCDLPELFAGQSYDYIVCADVLEHLPAPERVVRACHDLLAAEGRLLVSVPNTGYAGLIAELLGGEFRYREEGLLDATHVRHFTRRALLRFLGETGFAAEAVEPIVLPLPDSEFKAAFDALPPAVSRYLLATPDALTYQFIVVARAQGSDLADPASTAADDAPAAALFSAQLFLGRGGAYAETDKLVGRGLIGSELQTVRFALPGAEAGVTHLRLDPADRPGFLHLHQMRLIGPDGEVNWRWDSRAGIGVFAGARRHEMLLNPPWPLAGAAAVVLLHGDDPWIELPIAPSLVGASAGGALEVELGWPMSADYLALAGVASDLSARIAEADAQTRHLAEREARTADQLAAFRAQAERDAATAAEAIEQRLRAERELQAVRELAGRSAEEVRQIADREAQAMRQLDEKQASAAHRERQIGEKNAANGRLQHRIDTLNRRVETLGARNAELRSQHAALLARNQALSRERDNAIKHIGWIENSTVIRVTRPAVRAKMALDRALGRTSNAGTHQGAANSAGGAALAALEPNGRRLTPPTHPVDVIVPVYRGLADTRLCIESVLKSDCAIQFRLVVINDASPEPEVTHYLREVAKADERIVLLENEENLGFVGTVNRGMALSDSNDVLLLNSDTEVANDWLDRLRSAAWSDARVATVTPFSNNATICSYPRFCEDNDLPGGWSTAELDRLFARANVRQAVDVPTGIGFCMYVRRDALDAIGLFDVENFGKGYGEENDFCQRALEAGWRNLHALDVFVMHSGGVSFGDSKSPREAVAMQTLRRMHPTYETQVHTFLAADPARLARLAVDLARVRARGLPVVLAVLHDRGGGTVRHVQELSEHLREQVTFFVLRPAQGGQVLLELASKGEAFCMAFDLANDVDSLLAALRSLGVRLIHYHHLIGHGDSLLELPRRLGLPYDFTAHDFFTVCPQITFTYAAEPGNRYCGELGVAQCNKCLGRSAAPGGLDIKTWRDKYSAFLHGARHVLAPSRSATAHLARYVPAAQLHAVPHTDMDPSISLPVPSPERLEPAAPLKIAVIGALSPIKGADVLEDVAMAAARADAPIDFHLIGFAYRSLRTQPRARLTVHGEYREEDLPGLLEWLKPDLVWFPALWPETYSYTLSACLQAGLPVAAPDLGAFAERLVDRDWTWVLPWDQTPAQWLAFFSDARQRFVEGRKPAKPIRLVQQSVAAAIPSADWSYRRNYLEGLGGVEEPEPAESDEPFFSSSFVAAHLPGRAAAGLSAQVTRGVKGKLLHTALRMRAAPGLSSVARAIPLRWQTRFKTWLRA